MSEQIKNAIKEVGASFLNGIDDATRELQARWRCRKEADARDLLLDVLFFRNSAIYQAIRILLDQWCYAGAEMLLRPLFEGTLTFEWCMLDPDHRAFRFRRTSFKSTLEIAGTGLHRLSPERVATLQECVRWSDEQGHKGIPNVRQMTEEVQQSTPGMTYDIYKRQSKIMHGSLENWWEYMPRPDETEVFSNPLKQEDVVMLYAMAGHLQLRNIHLVGRWDACLKYDGSTDLERYYTQRYEEYLRSREEK